MSDEPYQQPLALRWLIKADGSRVLQVAVPVRNRPGKAEWQDVREEHERDPDVSAP